MKRNHSQAKKTNKQTDKATFWQKSSHHIQFKAVTYTNTHTKLESSSPRRLIRPIVPYRHLHLQSVSTVPEVLGDKHGGFFANQQSRTVSVAADVVGTDGQVGAFETFDAVHVEARV